MGSMTERKRSWGAHEALQKALVHVRLLRRSRMHGTRLDAEKMEREVQSTCIIFYREVGFFFSSRRRHTRFDCDWSSDVCSSDLRMAGFAEDARGRGDQDERAVAPLGHVTQEAAGGEERRRQVRVECRAPAFQRQLDRKSTRLNSSHSPISYAVF